MAGGYRLGIDFGTSHTVAVLAGPAGPVRPLLFDGSPLLPSGVYADPASAALTGRDAAHAARVRPEFFEPHPKQRIDERVVLLGEAEVAVRDLIVAVLRRVAGEARRVAGGPIAATVLTCPAGWGQPRRRILRDAAAEVFTEPVLVPEPVAAASHFVRSDGGRIPTGGSAVVYDFGAGTFDVSVVRRTPEGFDVLATRGLTDVGGLDIDAAIVGHLERIYAARDPDRWARLARPGTVEERRLRRSFWDDVRAGKEMLSRATTTVIPVPLFNDDAPFGREQLDELARPILDRTVETTRSAIELAGVAVPDLAGLFLVGGSSRLPLAATLLHRAFGIPPTVVDHPELVVAEGSLQVHPTSGPGPGPAPVASAVPVPGSSPGRAVSAGPVARAFGSGRVPPWAGIVAAAFVAAVLAAVGVVLLTDRYVGTGTAGDRGTSAPGATTAVPTPTSTPTPTPSPVSGPRCLVGTWRQTSNRADWVVDGRKVKVTSEGTVNRFRADGVAVVEYLGRGVTRSGRAAGRSYAITTVGTITFRYEASDTTIYYRDAKAHGTITTKVDGRVVSSGRMTGSVVPERYTCSGDRLRFGNEQWTIEAVRLSTST